MHVGGPCKGCEVIYTSPVPFNGLNEVDTLPDFNERGPKLLISGIVYKAAGTTPASDAVLYVYQSHQTGRYKNRNNEQGFLYAAVGMPLGFCVPAYQRLELGNA